MGFGGQYGYYHDYTGWYLLGHRYFDAYTGRFVTRDPIGYKGGINLYGFADGNPVNESDPNGTQNGSRACPALPDPNESLNDYQRYTFGMGVNGDDIHGSTQAGASRGAGSGPGAFEVFINWIKSISKGRPGARPGGVQSVKVGNVYKSTVDPGAPKLVQAYGKLTIAQKAAALDRLGDLAAPHVYLNGELTTLDIGSFSGSNLEFLNICERFYPFEDTA